MKSSFDKIEGFEGEFEFMQLKYNCKVYHEDVQFGSAWQAMEYARCKTSLETGEESQLLLSRIRKAPTTAEMLSMTSKIPDGAEWTQSNKMRVAKQVVWDKFLRNSELMQ